MASSPADTGRRYGGKTVDERRAERRERFLAAGLELFGTRGYAATTIPALCSEAGLATRYFYESFDSREDLFLALYDDLAARVRAEVEAAVAAAPQELEPIAAASVRASRRAYADKRVERIVLLEITRISDRAERHRRAALDEFARTSADAIRAATKMPPRRARALAIGLVGGITELLVHRAGDPDSISDRDVVAAAVALTRAALQPPD
jgi:AcrR family transcriptional regulator